MENHAQLELKRLTVLIGIALSTLVAADPVSAETAALPPEPSPSADHAEGDEAVEFASGFMVGNSVDASQFKLGNPVLPGTYAVDLYLNDVLVSREKIRFDASQANANAKPCLTLALLDSIGVDTTKWERGEAGKDSAPVDRNECVDLPGAIPAATVSYNSADQRLDLSVPQASLRNVARGEVNPSRWDRGETAGIAQYDFNAYHSKSGGRDSNSVYLGLTAGVNLGAWRFRSRGSLNYSDYAGTRWESLETYAQRDLTGLRAQLTLGDSNTRGDVFDSFGLRGVQITSDDRMLPDSLRGFAPTVRGVAQSNAKVEIKQNGAVIYQTTVAPGPFEIRGLNPTGYGGDLEVIVTEADGFKQIFSVPYATVPQLLRPGVSRFSVAAGQYRTLGNDARPYIGQAIYQRGLTNLITGYGGVIGSKRYGAALMGVAVNTSVGALALDVTAARTQIGNQKFHGQSWRVSFAKYVPQTDTSLTMAAYRYSTSGYFSLADAVASQSIESSNYSVSTVQRQRNRAQVNISQKIGSGSVYLMGSAQDYWNRTGSDLQFQIGYSNGAKWGSYSLSAQRTRNAYGHQDTQYFASVSLPFGGRRADSQPLFSSLNTSVTTSGNGGASVQTSASGSAGAQSQWSYGLNAGYTGDSGDHAASLGVYGAYNGGKGSVNMSASAAKGSTQASLGLSGALVAHKGGLTLGQRVSPNDPIGLIEAKGALGAAVTNASGVTVDSRGYAVVPYMTAYRINTLVLDPQGMSEDTELESTSQDVVPRAGAVVRAKFDTKVGKPVLMRVRTNDDKPVPMGADVLDSSGGSVGVVGQGGTVFVRGVPDAGELSVRWALGPKGECTFRYEVDVTGTGNAEACATTSDREWGGHWPRPKAMPKATEQARVPHEWQRQQGTRGRGVAASV